MLFAIFILSVITLEWVLRSDARKRSQAAPAVAQISAAHGHDGPPIAIYADAASVDLLRMAEALAASSTKQLREQEPSSSSNSSASRQEAADRSF